MKRRGGWMIVAGGLLAGCWTGGNWGGDSRSLTGSPGENCGFELAGTPAAPAVDACVDGPEVTTLFSETFTRTPGPPVRDTRTVTVLGAGALCIKVRNGDGTKHTAVASAVVTVDDTAIIGESAFNPNVPAITARPTLQPGDHELGVELRSEPSSFVTVEVRFAAAKDEPRNLVAGPAGRLEIYNLFDDADPFSPANADGVRDEVTLGITAAPLMTPGTPSGRFDYRIRARFEIAGGIDCGAVRTLVTERSVVSAIGAPITTRWDGRDAGGDLVADGTYYYRATVELLARRLSGGPQIVIDQAVSAIQTVTVDNTPPVVTMLTLANGDTFRGTRAVAVSASDDSGVVSTRLLFDSDTVGTKQQPTGTRVMTSSFVVDSGLEDNGNHVFAASAVDIAGNEGMSGAISVAVANPTGLTISAVTPPSGGAGTIVTITGSGFDPGGTAVRLAGLVVPILDLTTTGIRVRLPALGATGSETLVVETSTGTATASFLSVRSRVVRVKTPLPQFTAGRDVLVKFAEGTQLRVRDQQIVTLAFDPLDELLSLLNAFNATASRMFVSASEQALTNQKLAAETRRRDQFANLNLHIALRLPSGGVVIADFGGDTILGLDQDGTTITQLPLPDLAWTENNAVKVLLGTATGYDAADIVTLPGADPVGAPSNPKIIQPSEIVAADFNEDGIVDLVVGAREVEASSEFFGDLLYYEGLGDGSFANPVRLDGATGAFAAVLDLAVADLDGDGKRDIIVGGAFATGTTSPSLIVFFGTDATASPPFETRANFAVTANACCTSTAVVAARQSAGDLNGDGRDDVVMAFRDPIGDADLPGVVVMMSTPTPRQFDVRLLTNDVRANDVAVSNVDADLDKEVVFIEDERFANTS